MTVDPARLAALEVVVERARELMEPMRVLRERMPGMLYDSEIALLEALDTLPAQPQPAGEGLTLAVWADRFGTCYLAVPGTDDDADNQGHRRHLATVTIPIARVEPGA